MAMGSGIYLDYFVGTLSGEDRGLCSLSAVALSSLYGHHDGKFVAILYRLAWISVIIV